MLSRTGTALKLDTFSLLILSFYGFSFSTVSYYSVYSFSCSGPLILFYWSIYFWFFLQNSERTNIFSFFKFPCKHLIPYLTSSNVTIFDSTDNNFNISVSLILSLNQLIISMPFSGWRAKFYLRLSTIITFDKSLPSFVRSFK